MRPGGGARRLARELRRQARLAATPGRRGRSHASGPSVSALPLPPVFVGGTGRSGTTIAGRLLGSHPAYHMIPLETKFISTAGGLCDLVEGWTTLGEFEDRLYREWFVRGRTGAKGLHAMMDREAVDAAMAELRKGYRVDAWRAAATFTHRLLDPLAVAVGASGWVEMTPTNAQEAAALLRLFPDMRLVHTIRDGRDVACSLVRQPWGPGDYDEALDWWDRRLELAFQATDALPPDRLLVVQLEELVMLDRERGYGRLLAFLGLPDDPAMRAFFDGTMTPEGAHFGRWRRDVPPDRLPAFEAHYDALAARIAHRGRPYHPDGRKAPAGPVEAPAPEPEPGRTMSPSP